MDLEFGRSSRKQNYANFLQNFKNFRAGAFKIMLGAWLLALAVSCKQIKIYSLRAIQRVFWWFFVLFWCTAYSGSNGDRLEFSYKDGMRSGPAVYHFADGSKEVKIPFYHCCESRSGGSIIIWPPGSESGSGSGILDPYFLCKIQRNFRKKFCIIFNALQFTTYLKTNSFQSQNTK